ncbi:hypothetical protein [Paragemmobacter ruber]|uniref:Uncharacterized protein n=1 Tax=Paragemmobacter ruber TaxID=1985673 RepID=A0ABW9Y0B3_9RHOB|nr:hypothetical protein [Rhodobacter ruber]NBE05926.1 hypothetical protein [Rhodobacter ruber]
MIRSIIDLPSIFLRLSKVDWDIDPRGRSAGEDVRGGDQVVVTGFPRFIAAPELVLPEYMIGHFRAIRARLRGRQNAVRVAMIDPIGLQLERGEVLQEWRAYLAGQWVEPRPVALAVGSSLAGAASIVIDERAARQPVRVGQYLSYQDWPFLVTGRSGAGAAVTLQVEMLRRAIPAGAQIDLLARGVFLNTDLGAGNPAYGMDRVAAPRLVLSEWITR